MACRGCRICPRAVAEIGRDTITLDVPAGRPYVKSLIVEAGNADEGTGPLGPARKAQISE